MKSLPLAVGVFALLTFASTTAPAAEVTVRGVHLCCVTCVKAVTTALAAVDGVSDAACDRRAQAVTFSAAGDKAALAGVNALAAAGFHGTATHAGREVHFPPSGAKPGDRADAVTITGVHLCCGACVKAAETAVFGAVAGVQVVANRKTGTLTVTGNRVAVVAVVTALNKAGFHGTVKQP